MDYYYSASSPPPPPEGTNAAPSPEEGYYYNKAEGAGKKEKDYYYSASSPPPPPEGTNAAPSPEEGYYGSYTKVEAAASSQNGFDAITVGALLAVVATVGAAVVAVRHHRRAEDHIQLLP